MSQREAHCCKSCELYDTCGLHIHLIRPTEKNNCEHYQEDSLSDLFI